MVFSRGKHRIVATVVHQTEWPCGLDDEHEREIFVSPPRAIQLPVHLRALRIAGIHLEEIYGRSCLECACGKAASTGRTGICATQQIHPGRSGRRSRCAQTSQYGCSSKGSGRIHCNMHSVRKSFFCTTRNETHAMPKLRRDPQALARIYYGFRCYFNAFEAFVER
jgi:hypothetical protein